jgi:DNA-binding response OmpR family regulator
MAKILVVEDELKIQQIIRAYLEKDGHEIFTALNGAQGSQQIREVKPDLVILDLMLPVIPGEQLLIELRQSSDIPVIILSAKTTEAERIFGLNIGADDYLAKPFSPRELVARVNAHLRRMQAMGAASGWKPGQSFNGRRLVIDPNKYEVLVNGATVGLTPTEFKVLQLLAQTPGRVYTRSQLVELIQGYSYDGYDRTIDSHIKNLRHKIEPNPEEPIFIITIYGVGYKFGGERDV